MKVWNKLFALLLTVSISVGVLSSCDLINPPKEEPEEDLAYTAIVDIKFTSDDEAMKAAIEAMKASAVILSKGDDVSVVTTSESASAKVVESYLLSNSMLFYSLSVEAGEEKMERLRRARFGESAREELLTSIGKGATISIDDFTTIKNESVDGLTVFSCSDMFDESRASLLKIMTAKFGTIGATVKVGDVTLTVYKDGKLVQKTILNCTYQITLNEQTYKVTMTTETSYDYESEVSIKFPGDTSVYEQVELSDIIK